MKTFCLSICFVFTATCFSQNTNKELTEKHQQLQKQQISSDSLSKNPDSLLQQSNKYYDSVAMTEQMERNNRNLDGLVSMMKERERKAKKQMWIRLGIGLAFLALGIYGFTRKRKKSTTQS